MKIHLREQNESWITVHDSHQIIQTENLSKTVSFFLHGRLGLDSGSEKRATK